MNVTYARTFKKMFRKQPSWVGVKFQERLTMFIKNSRNPILGVHTLSGEWLGCKSFNVTGDIRALFEEVTENHIEFVAIGTHSELYS